MAQSNGELTENVGKSLGTTMAAETVHSDQALAFAMLSDPGTQRTDNEDACGSHVESSTHFVVGVADGVSGEEGGEIASQTAIEVTMRAYRESPPSWGPAKRLFRAAQEANIEIHDRALVVPELRGMSTTLTALALDGSNACAVHVGDSRLYLIREGRCLQKTKDHTVAARRRRVGMVSAERAKTHPLRSTLTRSLGRELIAAIDRITFAVSDGDILLLCSDGLYNVLSDEEILSGALHAERAEACKNLIATANARGAPDNVTVAIVHVRGAGALAPASGWRGLLGRWS
jgi:serine/threonine protein phosphatase PrpC